MNRKAILGALLLASPWAAAPAPAQPVAPLSYVQPLTQSATRDVQDRLRQAGAYSGQVDGVWGRDSRSALERFQSTHGTASYRSAQPGHGGDARHQCGRPAGFGATAGWPLPSASPGRAAQPRRCAQYPGQASHPRLLPRPDRWRLGAGHAVGDRAVPAGPRIASHGSAEPCHDRRHGPRSEQPVGPSAALTRTASGRLRHSRRRRYRWRPRRSRRGRSPVPERGRAQRSGGGMDIRHVVVLMLENRSFDCMLGMLYPNSEDFDGLIGIGKQYLAQAGRLTAGTSRSGRILP